MTTDGENAEEEPTCPCKRKLTNVLLLECDQCENFWHITCCGLAGLTQQPINKLIANHWKCPRCFVFPEEVETTPADEPKDKVNLDQDTVKNIIALVNTTVMNSLKNLLSPEDSEDSESDTEDSLTAAADDEEEAVGGATNYTQVKKRKRKREKKRQQERQQQVLQKALEEQREEETLIEKKKDNLIIYGMPEPATDDKDEEMMDDFNNLKKIYDGKATIEQADLTHVTRLGKKAAKPRPILITLANQEKRKELLTKNMNLKLLNDTTHESIPIYVSTDRTKKQREDFNKLREELKERKKTDPNLTIRNNKIVPKAEPFRQEARGAHTWAQLIK